MLPNCGNPQKVQPYSHVRRLVGRLVLQCNPRAHGDPREGGRRLSGRSQGPARARSEGEHHRPRPRLPPGGVGALAEPENREAQQCAIDIFQARADAEISLMGRGIFSHAVRKAEKAIADMDRNA